MIWLDAAPRSAHTPDSSPFGAFSGMDLRAVLGDGAEGLALQPGSPRAASCSPRPRAYERP